MHLKPLLLTLVLTMTTLHAQTPPDVEKRPHTVTSPHGERQDEYYWLRDDERKDPQMLAYLNAENAYADAVLAPLQAQEDKLYDEIVARIKQDDSSVPERDRGYWYYTRFETGKDYPVHARRADWQEWIAHDPAIYLEYFEPFADYTAIGERSDGLDRIRIVKKDGGSEYLKADEPAYTMGISSNPEPDSDWLRYSYTSLTTPAIVYETNIKTGERRQLKQQPVPGYDASNYTTERVWVPARDGTKIPVSLVYRKDFKRDGSAAMLQYGYGSYGASMDPAFSASIISLLDRGMIYALAHIRGGQEMGRAWYEDGKLLHKKNTFTDFIDVTRWLVAEKYAAKDRVAALGGSAGGLLMGAVANMAPEDYRVILSQVPFVDVVTTMLDPSIPLTTNEYDEWGNPEASAESYAYMLSYSPYDNLKAQAYPAMFVGTGLWDSQVQYWEPAKYVARLRDVNTGKHPVILRTNMEAGHGGKSGRFRRYREIAEMYAFMLDQLNVK